MNRIPMYAPINNYPWYLVCEDGYVINTETGDVLRGSVKKTGYIEVCLRDADGKPHYFLLHRVIAMAFCEKAVGKNEVNHKDGNKRNNSAGNLEWVTREENLKHAFENGLRADDVAPKAVIATDIKTGETLTFKSIYSASKELGISGGDICMCCKGNRPYAGGFFWEYMGK